MTVYYLNVSVLSMKEVDAKEVARKYLAPLTKATPGPVVIFLIDDTTYKGFTLIQDKTVMVYCGGRQEYDPQARAFRVTAMAANWEPVGETVYE
jgi:hypothetical protein